jgi:hypothetical protein
MTRKLLFAIGLTLVVTSASVRADMILDSFSVGPQSITIQSGTSNNTAAGLPTTSVIGGTRLLSLAVSGNPLNLNASAAVIPSASLFSLSNDTLVTSTATITYNAGGAGLGGINLSTAGSQFTFNVLAADLSVALGVTATDLAGHSATSNQIGLSTGNVSFGFSSFAGVDFTQINSIVVTSTGPNSADFATNFFGVTGTVAVPEPPSAVLTALGFAGLMGFGWHRHRRVATP